MKLGDDYQYPIKGSGEYSYKLDFGKSLTMKEVLFFPGLKKRRWEVKIKLSQYTPSLTPSQQERKFITSRVSTLKKITLEEIYLGSYVIHVMKQDIMQGIVLRNQSQQRRATKEDIMLMMQRMMNHPRRDPDMKEKILQVRMNMF